MAAEKGELIQHRGLNLLLTEREFGEIAHRQHHWSRGQLDAADADKESRTVRISMRPREWARLELWAKAYGLTLPQYFAMSLSHTENIGMFLSDEEVGSAHEKEDFQ